MKPPRRLSLLIPLGAGLALIGGNLIYAQLEGAERGIAPVDSTSSLEVDGINVDVYGTDGQHAREAGYRLAQEQGWRMLWARSNGRPVNEAPAMSDSALNGIVAGIVVQQEQVGPHRYIATLGVLFDRGRTGPMLGIGGVVRRSQPMLVIPVIASGSTAYSFEYRNEWQRAWAQFRTASSTIDYVRTAGSGIDPLLLNADQAERRGRGWWRMLLDQYGAVNVLVPEVVVRHAYPGGPAVGSFTAYFGPDHQPLGHFELTAPNSAGIPAMMQEGVRRIDAIYSAALDQGILAPDPTLVIPRQPAPPPQPERQQEQPATPEDQVTTAPETPAAPAAVTTTFTVQVETPDAESVQRAEVGVSRVGGVTSALTTSLALGGTSLMRVTYQGDPASFAAALRSAGWSVSGSGTSLRISR